MHASCNPLFIIGAKTSGMRKIVQCNHGLRTRCRVGRELCHRKENFLTWRDARQLSSSRLQSNARSYATHRITPPGQVGRWLLGSCYSTPIHLTHRTSAVASHTYVRLTQSHLNLSPIPVANHTAQPRARSTLGIQCAPMAKSFGQLHLRPICRLTVPT